MQVPRESLLFVIPAFGGVVSWEGEGSPYKETDQGITYQVYLELTINLKVWNWDFFLQQCSFLFDLGV